MIAFDEIFPYDELMRMLTNLAVEERKLSKGRESFSKIYQTALKEEIELAKKLKKELEAMGSLKSFDLTKIAQQIDSVSQGTSKYEKLLMQITSAQEANEKSVKDLRGAMAELKKQYDNLDPTTAEYSKTQRELAEKAGFVKSAMEAQLSTLKAATRGVQAAEHSYNALSKETNKLRAELKNMPNAFDATTGAINKTNRAATDLQDRIQRNDKALKAMDASMGLYQRNVGNYEKALGGLGSALMQLTGIYGAVDLAIIAVTKSFETFSNFERYRAGLQAAIGESRSLNGEIKFLDALANRTGQSIDVLFGTYKSFAASARDTNLTLSEQRRIFTSVIEASSAMRLTNDQTERALNALQQMLSKGNIQAEELRGQLGEALPGAFNIMAKALGVSTSKLNDMLKAGEVLAEDALPKLATELQKTFGKNASDNINSLGGSWNRLTNEVKMFLDMLNQETRVTNFFSWFNNGLADTLRGIKRVKEEYGWFGVLQAAGLETFGMGRKFKDIAQDPQKVTGLSGFSSMSEQDRVAKIFQQMDSVQKLGNFVNKKLSSGNQDAEFYKYKDQLEQANKLLSEMVAIDKKLSFEKKDAAKNTEAETKSIKELRKELTELKKQLEEGTLKNSAFKTTDAGKKLLDRYTQVKSLIKQNSIKAGTVDPNATREEDNAFEKNVKRLRKKYDEIVNEIDSDIKAGKQISIPSEMIRGWTQLFDIVMSTSKVIGKTIPEEMLILNQQLSKDIAKIGAAIKANGNFAEVSSKGSLFRVKSDGGELSNRIGLDSKSTTGLLDRVMDKADTKKNMNEFTNLVKEQGFERLRLEASFSRGLRGIKQSEKMELLAAQREIFEAQKAGDRAREESAREQYNYTKERILAERDLRRQVAEEAFELSSTLVRGLFDIQTAYRDKELSQVEAQKEKEIQLAGENKEAVVAINKRADEQIRQIKVRQAKADKRAALFDVYINTSRALMSVLSTGGGTRYGDGGVMAGILSAIVIGQGLAQAALIAARPIPEFAKGTQYAPEGVALVGEKGAELRESNGKYFYYDKPTVAYLNQGDKIFTATQTANMLRESMLNDRFEFEQRYDLRGLGQTKQAVYTIDTKSIVEGLGKKFEEALQKQPYIKDTLDNGAIVRILQSENTRTKYFKRKQW